MAQQPGPLSSWRIPAQLVKMKIPVSPFWSIPHTLQHHVRVWEEPSVNTKGQGGHSLKLSCQHIDLLPKKVSGHWL